MLKYYLDVAFTHKMMNGDTITLKRLESDYEVPPFLLHFLRKTGGGRPSKTIHVSDALEYEVREFFSPLTIIEKINFFVEQKALLPSEWMPFADDSGGNVYAINKIDDSISRFLMDEGEVIREHVTNSFDEFVCGLVTIEEAYGC